MLIIRLEGEGALDLHSREFHVVQQHSIWGGPKHAKRQEAFQSCSLFCVCESGSPFFCAW